MAFDIEFLPPGTPATDPHLAVGRITVGSFSENFETDLGHWDRSRYEADWRANVRRILDGADRAALLTSLTEPTMANFFVWWPLYRDGDTVRIQNHLLFLEELPAPFDIDHPWKSVRDRETTDEDGNRFSEWSCSVSDLASWLNT